MIVVISLFVLSIILFIIYKINIIKNVYINSLCKYLSISLFGACLLEVTIFNFRHYESIFFSKNETELKISNTEGVECVDEVCDIVGDVAYFEILDIDKEAKNIYLDITSDDLVNYANLSVIDEGAGRYYSIGDVSISPLIDRSYYYRLNATGKIKSIKIKITNEEVNIEDNSNDKEYHDKLIENRHKISNIKINKILINVKVPMYYSNSRIFIVFILLFLVLFVYHKSVFHKIPFDCKITKNIVLFIILLLSSCAFYLSSCSLSSNSDEIPKHNQYQYQTLTEALLKGHVYLDLPVAEELKNLDNPYDTLVRNKKVEGKTWWDYAYYNGKYYSYFGIVPCLLLYLPYRVITGSHLRNFIALSITVSFFCFSVFYFYYQLFKKYYKNISLPYYLLFCLFAIFASGILFSLAEAGFYPIPIIMGLAFAHLGISCWIKYTMNDKHKILNIALGSLFISLLAGCRPQLLLSCLFCIPFFFLDIKKNKISIKKHTRKELIAFFLPVIIIAALVMTYNYVRFDSVFEFGAKYNLTTNDMTRRGIKLDRTILGYYSFLFQPNRIIAEFPFLETFNITTVYKGVNVFEGMHGGFFFINLICACSIIPSLFKEYIKDKELNWVIYLSMFIALVVIFADTQIAGILGRYFLDFSWLIILNTIIILAALLNKYGKSKLFCKLLVFFIIHSMFMNSLTYISSYYLFLNNPLLKYSFYYVFMFWV